jgi:arylsulfatase A-like enzyme
MESGVQLMSSLYPQSHGIRQMYPNRATVDATKQRIVPLAQLLRSRGYKTAAIGDWCAGYYDVIPLGFEDISVSSFDNFKIYMSQAVVMAHFVVPLYFDNPLGYHLFPQLESFAQFVTPKVVTQRVEQRLASAANDGQPFFWHVFFSCNHLPYRSPEPYVSMFSARGYEGRNRSGVDFDIDSFIGGTDLESKWKALPPKEVSQIRALYDGCTREFDDCVGKIIAAIERNGLAENTIVIITADHGDDHYEPGVTLGHGLTFNGGLHANRVPMIVHVPGSQPQVIPETVRLIDVVPSLADLVGQEKSPTWQGKSFAGWIRGTEKPTDRPFYGETGFPFIQFSVQGVERPKLPPMDECTSIDETYNYQFVLKPQYLSPLIEAKQRCLKTHHWKIVCTPTAQKGRHFGLFQMANDPYGETDLAKDRPEVLAPMQTALERWMDENTESSIAEIFPNGEPS